MHDLLLITFVLVIPGVLVTCLAVAVHRAAGDSPGLAHTYQPFDLELDRAEVQRRRNRRELRRQAAATRATDRMVPRAEEPVG